MTGRTASSVIPCLLCEVHFWAVTGCLNACSSAMCCVCVFRWYVLIIKMIAPEFSRVIAIEDYKSKLN